MLSFHALINSVKTDAEERGWMQRWTGTKYPTNSYLGRYVKCHFYCGDIHEMRDGQTDVYNELQYHI
jgi:hypothetical protein